MTPEAELFRARSQSICRWLLIARRVGPHPCGRCGGLVLTTYDPEPRHGRTVGSRCWNCGDWVVQWCRPNGDYRGFRPDPKEVWRQVEREIEAVIADEEQRHAE